MAEPAPEPRDRSLDPRPDVTPAGLVSGIRALLSADPTGRYQVEGEVARGGQGAILRVWDGQLRRHLAMKVSLGQVPPLDIAAALASGAETPTIDARRIGRFLEEAQITGQLDHPGIVPVHELGLDDQGRVFFTMKLVKGEDLATVFARVQAGEPGWTTTHVVSILLRACEALSYAHSKRVIHRDLKPANIMVGRYGEVFVMDWGLARVLDRPDDKDVRVRLPEGGLTSEVGSDRRERAASDPEHPLVTMDGDVVGTPAYMSPEQAGGRLELMGPPSDVYAVGAMLYQLLTGRRPYVAPDARVNNYAVLSRVQEGPPLSVTSLAPHAPPELVAICEKAMAREPADRYPDMSALAHDLRAWLEQRVVSAYEAGAVAELRKWVMRNKPLAASLAAAVLLLAGGLSTSLVFKARSDRNAEQATRKANDVLSLSAIQELKELTDRADTLWPATPALLPEYDGWLAEAQVLLDGSADHPGLKDHESKLAEIRARARPPTPAQVQADREASPDLPACEAARAEQEWMHRMLGDAPWPSEAEVEAGLAALLPTDPQELNEQAWKLVDPALAQPAYGRELEALVAARRAVAAAGDDASRAAIRDTLAWALFRCGRFEDALAEEQRAVDEAEGKRQTTLAASQQQLQQQAARWTEPGPRAERVAAAAAASSRFAELEARVGARRTFEFDDPQDRWWHAQLAGLVADLTALDDEATGLASKGLSVEHGWGIGRRADFARTIEERSVSGSEAARRWAEARAAIASSPRYGGLALAPQLGLLPLGADPDSGLWEFWHLQTGDEPVRAVDGRLNPTDATGVVFVLIPGGSYWMGAQSTDPSGRHYDPAAEVVEAPVHQVTLGPFFLSKYELTQAQWERFTAGNPSTYVPGKYTGAHIVTASHPVERVSWVQATQILGRLGLQLPTEAQWEYAARAGTDTPWWTGAERESLRGAANLADRSAAAMGFEWDSIADWPDLDDGWGIHAPVGSLRPNPFGLHDVLGNVREWCRDGIDVDFYSRSPEREPLRPTAERRGCVLRGGSSWNKASDARCSTRVGTASDQRFFDLGLRPGRSVEP